MLQGSAPPSYPPLSSRLGLATGTSPPALGGSARSPSGAAAHRRLGPQLHGGTLARATPTDPFLGSHTIKPRLAPPRFLPLPQAAGAAARDAARPYAPFVAAPQGGRPPSVRYLGRSGDKPSAYYHQVEDPFGAHPSHTPHPLLSPAPLPSPFAQPAPPHPRWRRAGPRGAGAGTCNTLCRATARPLPRAEALAKHARPNTPIEHPYKRETKGGRPAGAQRGSPARTAPVPAPTGPRAPGSQPQLRAPAEAAGPTT
jgi:hypothetical protein